MRRIATIGAAAVLAVLLAGTALGAAPVDLGTAGSFAVLAGTTVTNTGATTITGDVGLHPGRAATGFATVTLHGALHLGDAVALGAKGALVTAYGDAAGAKPVTNVPTELGGTTLKPGVYGSGALGLTGTLTLDGAGLYVFQAASTLIAASGSRVALANGASACDVYWQVGSSATLGTGTSFKGTVMALASIALQTGATLQGRALARNGAVTMDHNTIDSSACAAPGPTPKATPKAGAHTPAPLPATDTVGAAPAAVTDPIPASFLLLLLLATIAFGGVGPLRGAPIPPARLTARSSRGRPAPGWVQPDRAPGVTSPARSP